MIHASRNLGLFIDKIIADAESVAIKLKDEQKLQRRDAVIYMCLDIISQHYNQSHRGIVDPGVLIQDLQSYTAGDSIAFKASLSDIKRKLDVAYDVLLDVGLLN